MDRLILTNINELVTCQGNVPKSGKAMSNVGITDDDCILIEDGIISEVGKTEEILKKYKADDCQKVDCSNNAVLPGFIDSHTHFVFGGYRQDEYAKRLEGVSYMDILKAGGGISNTVNATRSSSLDKLIADGIEKADRMLEYGVTTVEGKSGYGLDKETELKQLRAMKSINQSHPIDIVPTFLGAHLVPKEYKGKAKEYLDFIINEVLPIVKLESLAEFVDIFCEDEIFDIEQSKAYLSKAKEMGFDVKLHADEIVDMGGASLAVELNATSADHLLMISDKGINDMAKSSTIATLLPATAFSLKKNYADARKIIDGGCAVALATDYNPGSSCTCSIPLIIALAALNMDMNTREIVTALTINSACALGKQDKIGSIEVGKKADILILDYPSIDFLPYYAGMNIVKTVIKNGNVIRR